MKNTQKPETLGYAAQVAELVRQREAKVEDSFRATREYLASLIAVLEEVVAAYPQRLTLVPGRPGHEVWKFYVAADAHVTSVFSIARTYKDKWVAAIEKEVKEDWSVLSFNTSAEALIPDLLSLLANMLRPA